MSGRRCGVCRGRGSREEKKRPAVTGARPSSDLRTQSSSGTSCDFCACDVRECCAGGCGCGFIFEIGDGVPQRLGLVGFVDGDGHGVDGDMLVDRSARACAASSDCEGQGESEAGLGHGRPAYAGRAVHQVLGNG